MKTSGHPAVNWRRAISSNLIPNDWCFNERWWQKFSDPSLLCIHLKKSKITVVARCNTPNNPLKCISVKEQSKNNHRYTHLKNWLSCGPHINILSLIDEQLVLPYPFYAFYIPLFIIEMQPFITVKRGYKVSEEVKKWRGLLVVQWNKMHAAVLCFIYFVLYLLRLTVDNLLQFWL